MSAPPSGRARPPWDARRSRLRLPADVFGGLLGVSDAQRALELGIAFAVPHDVVEAVSRSAGTVYRVQARVGGTWRRGCRLDRESRFARRS